MKVRFPGFMFFLLFASTSGRGDAQTPAPTPSFTISASNATMPLSGNGSIPVTLTSIDGYAGTIFVVCSDVNAPAGARVPYCGGGALPQYTLTADQTVTGSLLLSPLPVPSPANKLAAFNEMPGAAGLMLAGALLGCSLRRRARWLTLMLFAVGALTVLETVTGCGGGSPGLTPGTYAYTIMGTDEVTHVLVSTTANVIVP